MTEQLDPRPWLTPTGDYRFSREEVKFYGPDCVIFSPREGYSQNAINYPDAVWA